MHSPLLHRRTIAVLALLAMMSPLGASAIDDTQLNDVPLPAFDGDFQNTNYSGSGSFGTQVAQANTTSAGQTQTAPYNGVRPPILQPMLLLMPHCTEQDRSKCAPYDIVDPTTITMRPVALGDILDVDVVLQTPNPIQVAGVHAWLQYDPTALEARNIEMTSILPQPMPGEQEIDKSRGIVKIGGGAPPGSIAVQEAPIARVTFRVLSAQQGTTISFSDYKQDGTGKTAILDVANMSLLTVQPSTLRIPVGGANGGAQSSANSVPYVPSPVTNDPNSGMNGGINNGGANNNGGMPIGGTNNAFNILQVQGVRVTSQGDNLFVGWLPLNTSGLAGYNVYYGTVSGRYIQRRSLPASETSLSIRGLESGVQYFVAVRAYDTTGQETAFSEEASVVIGRPETSTSPLTQGEINNPPVRGNPIDNHNGQTVVGETGITDAMLWLVLAAAVAGTVLAWRRQLTLTPADHE